MSISNKEIIVKLSEYLMKQDQYTVCRTLANLMIDYNRLDSPEQMDEDEAKRLALRISLNAEQIRKFARGEGEGIPFTNINMENMKF